MTSISQRLGGFAAGLEYDTVPADVVRRAKACLLHGLVVGAGAATTGLGTAAEKAIGSARNAPEALAAFVNGVVLHARVQEDTHGTFHPGVTVIPAALAVAETEGVDGRTLLAAVVAGYEVGIALSGPLTDRSTPPHRATGVFGPAAAAAAAGRVLGLDAERMTAALSLAAALSGGSTESFGAGTQEWHFQSGQAAMTGVLAARLAQAGAQASPLAFEGVGGFLDCYSGGTHGAGAIGTALGGKWGILDVIFKPYPVCAFNQPPVLAAVRLATEEDVHVDEIESVAVELNWREATYPGIDSRGPIRGPEQAIMSTPYCVAVALANRHVTFEALRRQDDPIINALMQRIHIVADRDRAAKSARLTIALRDGRTIRRSIDDADDQLSWSFEQVVENARLLQPETHLTAEGLDRLVATIDRLEEQRALQSLVAAWHPTPVTHTGLAKHVTGWRPNPRTDHDVISPGPLSALSGLLGAAPPEPGEGLPPLWQSLFFLSWPAQHELGPDGHPRKGRFLPPIPDRTRMFAGGRLRVLAPLVIGAAAERRSELANVVAKEGRRGELVFVTVRHEFHQDGRLSLVEEQDLVYRSGRYDAPFLDGERRPVPAAPWQLPLAADPALLFRFSALTANAHRIHYDAAYARDVEGYPGLVVHGPLLALAMLELPRRFAPDRAVASVEYRLRRPVIAGRPVLLAGRPTGADNARLAVLTDSGEVHAEAELTFVPHPAGSRP